MNDIEMKRHWSAVKRNVDLECENNELRGNSGVMQQKKLTKSMFTVLEKTKYTVDEALALLDEIERCPGAR
jgi:hypothetical protein